MSDNNWTSARDEKALQLALEIEGLLMLRRERADNTPAEVEQMLRQRVAALADLIGRHETPAEVARKQWVAASVELEEIENACPDEKETPLHADLPPTIPATESPSITALDERLACDKARQDIHSAFTLNDRFRFRRELFAGDERRLNDALDRVQAMASLPEADDYFIRELGWDNDSPVVKDFMAVVAKHFA